MFFLQKIVKELTEAGYKAFVSVFADNILLKVSNQEEKIPESVHVLANAFEFYYDSQRVVDGWIWFTFKFQRQIVEMRDIPRTEAEKEEVPVSKGRPNQAFYQLMRVDGQ